MPHVTNGWVGMDLDRLMLVCLFVLVGLACLLVCVCKWVGCWVGFWLVGWSVSQSSGRSVGGRLVVPIPQTQEVASLSVQLTVCKRTKTCIYWLTGWL